MKPLLRTVAAGAFIAASTGLAAPIHNAAHKGDLERVKKEIAKGADVNTPKNGITPVMYAALNGHSEIAELLLANGATLTIHAAARFKKLEDVKKMLEDGVSANERDNWKQTPLFWSTTKEITELAFCPRGRRQREKFHQCDAAALCENQGDR